MSPTDVTDVISVVSHQEGDLLLLFWCTLFWVCTMSPEHCLVEPVKMCKGGWEASLLVPSPSEASKGGGRGVLIESNTCQVRLSQLTMQKEHRADCYDC